MKLKFIFLPAILVIATFAGCYYDNEEELYPGQASCDSINVTYSASLAPVLAAQCNGCHNGTGAPAGISTDNYTSVVANISRISGAINHQQGYSAMPKGQLKLDDCTLAKFKKWINSGTPNN